MTISGKTLKYIHDELDNNFPINCLEGNIKKQYEMLTSKLRCLDNYYILSTETLFSKFAIRYCIFLLIISSFSFLCEILFGNQDISNFLLSLAIIIINSYLITSMYYELKDEYSIWKRYRLSIHRLPDDHIIKMQKESENKKINYIAYDSKMFETDIQKFKEVVKEKDIQFDCIVTMYRGGLPFGVRLSHEFKKPLVIINYQRLDGDAKEPHISIGVEHLLQSKNILLVDDIYDTGKSIRSCVEYIFKQHDYKEIKSLTVATLVTINREDVELEPFDITFNQIKLRSFNYDENLWIQFEPWEGKIENINN